MGVSTMSDYERNVAASPFGQAIGRAGSVAVDEGLRAYMLRIYNYMVLGLAITGAAALGTYMLSVTTDPSIAALKMRDGLMLTAFGKALFVSPLKWVVIFRPLGLGIPAELRHRTHAPCDGATDVLDLRGAGRSVARFDLHGVHAHLDRAGVLHHRGVVRAPQPVGLHHPARPDRHGLVPAHGVVRDHPGQPDQPVHGEFGAAIRHLGDRRVVFAGSPHGTPSG
jgi:hypothetical protein